MSDSTRRTFVKSSAGAAAGLTALGAISTESADAELPASEADAVAGTSGVVAYVSDARKGEITVMSGERQKTVRDRALAARIVRASR